MRALVLWSDEKDNPCMKFVPVCKNCYYAETGVPSERTMWCNYYDTVVDEMDFCSNGKEREND